MPTWLCFSCCALDNCHCALLSPLTLLACMICMSPMQGRRRRTWLPQVETVWLWCRWTLLHSKRSSKN